MIDKRFVGAGGDEDAEDDSFEPPSWPHFLSFWNRFYPKLVIANPAEDICNQCYIFANQHKYSGSLQAVKKTEAELEDMTQQEIEKMQADEGKILKAAKHVEMAQTQRMMYQQKIALLFLLG